MPKLRPKIIPGEKKGKSSPSDANDDALYSPVSVRISWARLLKELLSNLVFSHLIKRVLAQRGDTVSIEAAGITVNEDLLSNSAQINGLELPQYRMEQKVLDGVP
jgi:type IV secretory pathway protease TraF